MAKDPSGQFPQHGKFSSTPNAYIIIVILITGAKVMAVLSLAKNKSPKFLPL